MTEKYTLYTLPDTQNISENKAEKNDSRIFRRGTVCREKKKPNLT